VEKLLVFVDPQKKKTKKKKKLFGSPGKKSRAAIVVALK